MKDSKTKERFIELRAQGKSYRTIEKEIGVGRHTLAKWENECKEELEKLTAIEFEALYERYRLTAQARAKRLGGQLERVTEELKNRDLSTVPTAKLVELAIKLDARLQEAAPVRHIPSEAALTARRDVQQLFDSLGPE